MSLSQWLVLNTVAGEPEPQLNDPNNPTGGGESETSTTGRVKLRTKTLGLGDSFSIPITQEAVNVVFLMTFKNASNRLILTNPDLYKLPCLLLKNVTPATMVLFGVVFDALKGSKHMRSMPRTKRKRRGTNLKS